MQKEALQNGQCKGRSTSAPDLLGSQHLGARCRPCWLDINNFPPYKVDCLVTNARSSGNMKASKVERLKAGVVEVNSVYLHFRGQTAVTEITLSTR